MPTDDAATPRDDASAPATLELRVRCGDLRFVRAPVLVGHYRSAHLRGSEAALDRVLHGELQRALDLGVYVEGPRTFALFRNRHVADDNPWAVPAPEAVLVVGLGEEGTLRLPQLVETVKQGVLAWAMRLADDPVRTATGFELCATLVGSGGTGVDVHGAAQSVARGVAEAKAALDRAAAEHAAAAGGEAGTGARRGRGRRRARTSGSPAPRGLPTLPLVTRLTIVEVYLSRAGEAWRALDALAGAEPERFVLHPWVETTAGAITRPPEEGYRGVAYDFVQVVTEEGRGGGPTLAFRLDTRRARNELREQRLQPPLVRQLVHEATHEEATTDPALGRTLFSLLVPLGLRTFLSTAGEFVLGVDAGTAALPWELMHDVAPDAPREQAPWAIRAKVVRKFLTDRFREQPRDAARDGHVLVIGDPDAPADRFEPLLAARREATEVATRLARLHADRGKLTLLVPGPGDTARNPVDATKVMNALFAHPYRVMHIAAHGLPPETPEEAREARGPDAVPDPRGIALSEGAWLGTREIEQLPVVPELVFLNCCYLGRGADDGLLRPGHGVDRPAFAAGVAQRLIEAGVRCVVAAGWTVADDAALEFARTFYDALLGGARFINAVAAARRATWRHDRDDTTWAAYQCYGDPDWRLVASTGERASVVPVRRLDDMASARGLAYLLEELAVRAEHGDDEDRALIVEQLRALDAALPARRPRWAALGDICEAMGRAFLAVGALADAVRWYDAAARREDGSASLRAVEQYANARARLAWRDFGAGGDDAAAAAAARDELARALATLESLLAIAPTSERHALVGSTHKRLAMVARATGDADAERVHLRAMRAAYHEAERIAAADGTPDFYPALNRLVADAALAARGEPAGAVDAAAFDAVRAMLVQRNADAPDFWTVVGVTELAALRALLAGELATHERALVQEFAGHHERCSAPRMWGSVADTWRFVLGGAPTASRPGHPLLAALDGWARPDA